MLLLHGIWFLSVDVLRDKCIISVPALVSAVVEGLASYNQPPEKVGITSPACKSASKKEFDEKRLILEADTAHGMDAMFILIHTRDSP